MMWPVVWLLSAVVFLLTFTGSTLLIQALVDRRRPSLAERLEPFCPLSVADEAERWLTGQRRR